MTTINEYLKIQTETNIDMLTLYKGYIAWRLKQKEEQDIVRIQDILNELAILHQFCINKAIEENHQEINFEFNTGTLGSNISTALKKAAEEYNGPTRAAMVIALAGVCAGLITAACYVPFGPMSSFAWAVLAATLYMAGAVAGVAAFILLYIDLELNEPLWEPAKDRAILETLDKHDYAPLNARLVEQVRNNNEAVAGLEACVAATTKTCIYHRFIDGQVNKGERNTLSLKNLDIRLKATV